MSDPNLPDDTAPVASASVGYQGQAGSFSARAAARCGRPVPFPSFDRLLRALSSGEVDEGVIPAATRVAGPVLEPLEALARILGDGAPILVAEEIEIPVRLVLAAPRGVELSGVREVWSQPPALRQCARLLSRLDAVPLETHDTAEAAQRVAALGGPRAAVCAEEAALEAGLVILEEDVSDVRPNATRFFRLLRASGAHVEPSIRALRFSGARLAATLSELDAEILALPGTPESPVHGFALIPRASLQKAAGLKARPGESLLWLGPTPDHVPPPRMRDLPRATEVRPPTVVTVGPFSVGGGKRAVIAGPCAVESPDQVMRLAKEVARAGATALRGGVFKPRTSPYAFQGHGLEALSWLREAGDAVGLPIVTEVMAP
ncbi:MAG: prephenate dehydratase domain-containing protein, partial [Acidithiobacillales bacterium]